jgi:hypothetical protein
VDDIDKAGQLVFKADGQSDERAGQTKLVLDLRKDLMET